MITTVDLPDTLLKEVDLLVEKRRAQRSLRPAAYKPTQPERHEAHRIAQEKGAAWANAYLKSLGPKREKVKASRGSVLIELAQSALQALAIKEAEDLKNNPPPAPKPPQLTPQGKPLPLPRKR